MQFVINGYILMHINGRKEVQFKKIISDSQLLKKNNIKKDIYIQFVFLIFIFIINY